MAYSDWNIVRRTAADNTGRILAQPSISGDPIVGDPNGRSYYYYDSNQQDVSVTGIQTRAHLVDSSYINLAHNNAISLRAKVRVNNFITNHSNDGFLFNLSYSIGLNAYSKQITGGPVPNNAYPDGFGGGYSLCLVRKMTENRSQNPDLYSTSLVIRASASTALCHYGYDGSQDVAICTGTYTTDTWYDIRFDVIPLSLTAKNLIAYTSPDGGTTWNQVGLYSVNIGNITRWSTNGYVGYESFLASAWGAYRLNATNNAETFIKDFKINVDPINFIP